MTHGKRTGVLLAAAVLAATAGCSTKASDGGGSGTGAGSGDVKTSTGVKGNEITLGVLTDLTGVFAALGADITQANTLFWEQQNAGEKVCGKYTVKLTIQDTGYVPQTGVQQYQGMKNEILALQQTIGSPLNTALAPNFTTDKMVNIPSAWARNLTETEGNIVAGATYDVELYNGLQYALDKGLIKKGDKLGHIYFEGEYGANGLAGAKAFASKNGLTVVEQKIKSTDTDMSSQVTALKSQGVKAIALTVGPKQTGSVAAVAAQSGLDVPLIGNNPVFSPALLKSPAAAALKKNLIVASPATPSCRTTSCSRTTPPSTRGPPRAWVSSSATADAEVMKQILEKACESKDLTRDGVLAAKKSLTNVDTASLLVPLDLSLGAAKSPSRKSFILQPADVAGGAKLLGDDAVEAPDASVLP